MGTIQIQSTNDEDVSRILRNGTSAQMGTLELSVDLKQEISPKLKQLLYCKVSRPVTPRAAEGHQGHLQAASELVG